eukprot:NODE_12081_length_1247_cov_4.393750.p9 GENE.NODE_12081_length_1247_cov_4.393750~~NODE_12081_length_1247_cov_4.393750.p9  ORF type:complete len:65 (+),score=33.64 NODE_12081_length_1247_cov_4.393750:951-1145(+)
MAWLEKQKKYISTLDWIVRTSAWMSQDSGIKTKKKKKKKKKKTLRGKPVPYKKKKQTTKKKKNT